MGAMRRLRCGKAVARMSASGQKGTWPERRCWLSANRRLRGDHHRPAILIDARLTHFLTKLFFAAPASGLPSLLTAAVSQHFLIALVLAAPASGLPSLLSALVAHDCASAAPVERDITSNA